MKTYDLVLFGATGFTGNLIATYLSNHSFKENISWAIAGRDFDKLQTVQNALINSKPDIIVADVKNQENLNNMASSTRLLMNTVGPFNWYGYPVIKACVENKTHYIDITGEPLFIHKIYDLYHKKAVSNGCTIVNCCGFDSIPADFATWLTVKKMNPSEPKVVKTFVRTNASFSGGTITTAIHALYEQTKGNTVGTRMPKHPDSPKLKLKIHFSKEMNSWAIPMPVVDPHIVKRTAFKMPDVYGPFAYGQYFVRSSFWKVIKLLIPIAFISFFVRFEWFRNWLFQKFQSGTGPSIEKRNKSKFEVKSFGESTSSNPTTIFSGGDPGYDETAKMFSESAFCILEKEKNNQLINGVLTPVEAFGSNLVERLIQKGIQIE